MSKNEDQIINQAINILTKRLKDPEVQFAKPGDVKSFLTLKTSELEHEVFAVLLLDTRHRLIEYSEMFRGTIDGAAVYPREVAKKALNLNAAAVIFGHNHPSGVAEPSQADIRLTERLKKALSLFDIHVLDHIIVGGTTPYSFAENGLL